MQLNPTHYLAIDMLLTGETNKAIAEKLNVAPETVSKWRGDFDFQAALNELLKVNQEATGERLRNLSGIALDTIENVMLDPNSPHKDRLAASMKVLELVKAQPTCIGSTEATVLRKEEEKRKLLDSIYVTDS